MNCITTLFLKMKLLIVALLEEKGEKKKSGYIFKKGYVIKSTLTSGRKAKACKSLFLSVNIQSKITMVL